MIGGRRWLPGLALAMLLLAPLARAQGFDERRFNLTPFVGQTFFDRELKDAPGPMLSDHAYFGGRLGARLLPHFWLELASGYTTAKSCNCDATWTHNSANLMLVSPVWRSVSPFASLGFGVAQYRPIGLISSDRHNGNFEAAGGVKVRLADAIGLRLEARDMLLVPNKDWSKSHIDNMVLGAGLVYAFGGQPRDGDGDGVPDRRDRCPDTPHGCQTGVNGCPIDSDGDGVCDGLDACPNTPAGARVDARGCPIDSDGDGVFDGLDACANTPKGCTVDARGCPADADGDGVFDGLDACANTPKGCTVDARGCPIDADGDGVCDALDRCPNTPAGARVDPAGCPIVEVTARETELIDTGRIRLSNINFDTGKASIRPDAYAVLDTVGRVLTKWPGLLIEVGGHTDSRGSNATNRDLSQRRAVSVRAYLLAHFMMLKAGQITSRGYGGSKPLVPNTSPANMEQNRRVEFVVLNKEILKRER